MRSIAQLVYLTVEQHYIMTVPLDVAVTSILWPTETHLYSVVMTYAENVKRNVH